MLKIAIVTFKLDSLYNLRTYAIQINNNLTLTLKYFLLILRYLLLQARHQYILDCLFSDIPFEDFCLHTFYSSHTTKLAIYYKNN